MPTRREAPKPEAQAETQTLKRGTLIELESKELGVVEYSLEHAQNILNLPQNTGWKLPQNSPYAYENGKIIRSAGTGAVEVS